MGGIHIFEKPCYREIRAMRGRVMRGLPVLGRKFLKKRIKKSLFLWHHGAMHVILSKLKKLLLHFFKAPIV